MPRFIASYTNDSAIQTAVDDGVLGHPYVALDDDLHKIDWNGKDVTDYSKMYFTIEVISAGTINLNLVSGKNIQYSVNNGQTWQNNDSISAQPGVKIMYKGTNDALTGSTFSASTAYFNVYGNSMSLLYGDNFIGKTTIQNKWGTFANLFKTSKIVDASNLILPATTVYVYSYQYMFYNCSSLISAPALPATELGGRCYGSMFRGCTSLTTAPELPATSRGSGSNSYEFMFYGCTSLNYIKCLLKAVTSVANFTLNWVNGVSPTGTFVKASNANWTTGDSGIPSGWTVINA